MSALPAGPLCGLGPAGGPVLAFPGARGGGEPYGPFDTPPATPGRRGLERKVVPASQPRVIAIVVNHNGRAFLRDTFRGLAAQTRPIDAVLGVDTGSPDGSADWARSRLGDDAVLAVRGQFGRAVMSALRDPRTSGMDWLWLLHAHCAPEPEALESLLAEAESRPSASILGPKLVSWTNPDRLSEIGFSIDRTGRAVSAIEDDEIDQGQHDQIRDVFYVNTAGMLVRRGALLNVGGFDERMPAFGDDLDLCWRAPLGPGRGAASARWRGAGRPPGPGAPLRRRRLPQPPHPGRGAPPLPDRAAHDRGHAQGDQPPQAALRPAPGHGRGLGLERQGAAGHDRPPPPPPEAAQGRRQRPGPVAGSGGPAAAGPAA